MPLNHATAFIAAALLLAAGSPVLAGPSASPGDGFIAVDGSFAHSAVTIPDDPADNTDFTAIDFGGRASAEYSFTPNLGVQGDLVLHRRETTVDQMPGSELDDFGINGAAHLFYRNGQFLLGAFAQTGSDRFSEPGSPESSGVNHLLGGMEGQAFLGNATLYAQIGAIHFADTDTYPDYEDGWFGTFEARYFLTPDLRLDGHAGIETESNSGTNKGFFGFNTTMTVLNAGAGVEYRVADTPFSLFAQYDHYHGIISESGTANTDADRILVGAKLNLDTQTLLDRDRSGAALKPFEPHLTDLFDAR